MITSNQIRSNLKQWDTWRNKVTKTKAILDRKYSLVDVVTMKITIPIVMDRMAKEGMIYGGEGRDCDNFANVFNTFFYLEWIKTHDLEPSVFRCIIDTGNGFHAISIIFTDKGIYFIEPQNGSFWSVKEFNPKILAVT